MKKEDFFEKIEFYQNMIFWHGKKRRRSFIEYYEDLIKQTNLAEAKENKNERFGNYR